MKRITITNIHHYYLHVVSYLHINEVYKYHRHDHIITYANVVDQ